MGFVDLYWKKVLWAIIMASFLLSLSHSFYFKIEPSVDAGAYDRIAVNVLNGHGYRQNFDLPFEMDNSIGRVGPGYEFFLVGVYYIFGHHYQVIWILQAIFHALSVLLVFLIARKVFEVRLQTLQIFQTEGRTSAYLISAALFGFYPDLIIGSSMLLAETLAIFLMLLVVYLFFIYRENNRLKYVLGAGLVYGFSILVRSPLLLLGVLFIFLFYQQKSWRHLGLFLAIVILIMTPWTIRNFKVYGAFIPISLTLGDDLLAGNHPGASGELDESRIPINRQYDIYDIVTADRKMTRDVIWFIATNPIEFLKTTFWRISMYFSFVRPTGWWPYLYGSLWQPVVLLLSSLWSVIIFSFGFFGIVEVIRSSFSSRSVIARSKRFLATLGTGSAISQNRSAVEIASLPMVARNDKKVIWRQYNKASARWLLVFLVAVVLPVIFIVVETRYRYPSYAFFAIFAGFVIVEAIYPVRSPAKPLVSNGLKGEADLHLSPPSGNTPSLTSNGASANGRAMLNARRLITVFLILFGNTVFDIIRNWEKIVSRLPDLF